MLPKDTGPMTPTISTADARLDPSCYTYSIRVGIRPTGVHYTVEEAFLDPNGISMDRRVLTKPETMRTLTDNATEYDALKCVQNLKQHRVRWCEMAHKYHGVSL